MQVFGATEWWNLSIIRTFRISTKYNFPSEMELMGVNLIIDLSILF